MPYKYIGMWVAGYQPDQDKNKGFLISQYRYVLDMTRGDSMAIPLGYLFEARVLDGYVLTGVVREKVDGELLEELQLDFLTVDLLQNLHPVVQGHLARVQQPTAPHRPYRGPYLFRAYNQFDGDLMVNLGAGPPRKASEEFCTRHQLLTTKGRREVSAHLSPLISELRQELISGPRLVPAFEPEPV